MAETARLEMAPAPSGKPRRFFSRRLFFVFFVAVAVVLSVLGGQWLAGGRVSSVSVVPDGEWRPLGPEVAARPGENTAGEGDGTAAGRPYSLQGREGARGAAGARISPEEAAGRLEAARRTEKDIVERLALARNEEEAKRRIREERVMEHARAQLALRSLDSRGGERTAGGARYQEAIQAEARARAAMEAAGDDFERFSRVRAAMVQEASRMREEAAAVREGRGMPPFDAGGAGLRTRAAGREQPVLFDGRGAGGLLGLVAYFPLAARDNLAVGQICDVRLEDGAEQVRGEVVEIMPSRALPPDAGPAAGVFSATEIFVPVRVRLDQRPKSAWRPGGRASCVVRTRGPLGFRGL
jgi:membrane fusion protein (multidrug efflux system)